MRSRKPSVQVVPPDGGWGWLVVLGTLIICLLIPPLGNCFGILFSRLLIQLESSTTTISWIFSVLSFLWCLSAIFVGPLCDEFGWRKVALLGAAISSMSIIISAFATSSTYLFFSFSLLAGIGGGLSATVCFLIIPYYFERRRGLANAIMMGSAGLGQIVVPPLARYLQDEFGFLGATLIMGAIVLNACVGAILFHPVEWHGKPLRPSGGESRVDDEEAEVHRPPPVTGDESINSGASETSPQHRKLLSHRRVRELSECSYSSAASVGRLSTAMSSVDVSNVCDLKTVDLSESSESTDQTFRHECSRVLGLFWKVTKTSITNIAILKQFRASIISIGNALLLNGYLNFLMLVPFALQAEGHSLQAAAHCISVAGITNSAGRLLISTISDYPKIDKKLCYMAGVFILATSSYGFSLMPDLTWKIVVMGFWGFGLGSSFGILNLLMIDIMGLENFGALIGATSFSVSITMLFIGPLTGFIRDMTGSYVMSLNYLASILLIAFCMWLFMPRAIIYDKKRELQELDVLT